MDTNATVNLYNEVYKTAKTGFDSIVAMEKVLGNENPLRNAMDSQKQLYTTAICNASAGLNKLGKRAEGIGTMKKIQMRTAVTATMLMDKTPSRAAEMMIEGTTMGITQLQQKLNQCTQAQEPAKSLSSQLLQGEQKHIDEMKKYL